MHLRRLTVAAWICLFAAMPAPGQTGEPAAQPAATPQAGATTTPAAPLQYNCDKEQEPFASYCPDVNMFLATAAAHRSNGKIDRANRDVNSTLTFLDITHTQRFIAQTANDVAVQNALASALTATNENRPDKETSAPTGASGTTSLVEKAGVPAILAFALESGALTRTVSGNTATLSGNLDGILRLLTGQQVLCLDCKDAFGTKILRDIGVSAAFLVNQQNTTAVPTSGPANASTPPAVASINIPSTVGKLSSITARYQLRNPYDPRSPQFRAAWNKAATALQPAIEAASKDLQQKVQALLVGSPVKSDAQFEATLTSYREKFFADAEANDLNKLREDVLALFHLTIRTFRKDDPDFNNKLAAASISLAQYKEIWKRMLEQAEGKPLFTLEYLYSRPQSQPGTHDIRAIFGYTPHNAVGLLSLNAAVSVYASVPSGARYGRLRDGQIAAEYDRPFTLTSSRVPATFCLAAYWQYQPDPGVLNITAGNLAPGTNIVLPGDAQVLLGTPGSLFVAQAKLAINAKSGIKVPIAVKWANKTDLLSGNKIGAQIGISYDFSSLSSLLGGQ